MNNNPALQYFATLEDQTFLDELLRRVTQYRNFYQGTGLASRWSLSLGNYYGTSSDGKTSWQVTMGGENGELVQQKVNEYASYVKHQITLAVKERPAGIAKAINWDIKTLRDARVGTQVVEYYFTDPAHAFESDYIRALRLALLTAEAYVVQDWDTSRGPEIAVDEMGSPINMGDITQWVYGAWDAARPLWCPNGKAPWYIFSRRVNKWDLAAQFPAYHDEIVMGGSTHGIVQPFYGSPEGENCDYIEEFLFLHPPSPAAKKGRYTRFTVNCKFLDVPYPYEFGSNVHRVVDEDLIESSFGHTSNYDLLGLEQVTDALHSIILNNQSTFGVASLKGVKGNGLNIQDLAKGLRYFELDPAHFEKFGVMDLVKTAPEIFNYLVMMSAKKGDLSGINSVIKGNPDGALKGASGAALALMQSQALVYNSGVQKSFYGLLSSSGTGVIEFSRQFADEPRIGKIAGKANRQAVKEFKYDGKTMKSVSTVVFEPVNPIMQTAGGKLAVADNLLEKGMVTSPKRYLEVLTTGNLDALIGDDVFLQDAIMEENEYLAEGKPVQVVITENHEDHIKGHQATLAMPNAKDDPDLVVRTLEHIQDHINQWTTLSLQNPALLLATGQKVLPPVPQPGLPPGMPAPGAPGPGPADAMSPQGEPAGLPNLPNPPTDPGTGEPAPVAPGTDVQQAA